MKKSELMAVMMITSAGMIIRYMTIPEMISGIILACILAACAYSDLNERVIPDKLLRSGICLKMLLIPFHGDIVHELIIMAAGASALLLILLPVTLVYEKLRKRSSIGGGDIKLFILVGAWIGPWRGIESLLMACMSALTFRVFGSADERQFPWGPSIALGTYFVMIFG